MLCRFVVFLLFLHSSTLAADQTPGKGDASLSPTISESSEALIDRRIDEEFIQMEQRLRGLNETQLRRLEIIEGQAEASERHLNRILLIFGLSILLAFLFMSSNLRVRQRMAQERVWRTTERAETLMRDIHRELSRPEMEHLRVSQLLRRLLRRLRSAEGDSQAGGQNMQEIREASMNPHLPTALHFIARVLVAEFDGQWNTAARMLEQLREMDSKDPDVLLHLSHVHRNIALQITDRKGKNRHQRLAYQYYAQFATIMQSETLATDLSIPKKPTFDPLSTKPVPEVSKEAESDLPDDWDEEEKPEAQPEEIPDTIAVPASLSPPPSEETSPVPVSKEITAPDIPPAIGSETGEASDRKESPIAQPEPVVEKTKVPTFSPPPPAPPSPAPIPEKTVGSQEPPPPAKKTSIVSKLFSPGKTGRPSPTVPPPSPAPLPEKTVGSQEPPPPAKKTSIVSKLFSPGKTGRPSPTVPPPSPAPLPEKTVGSQEPPPPAKKTSIVSKLFSPGKTGRPSPTVPPPSAAPIPKETVVEPPPSPPVEKPPSAPISKAVAVDKTPSPSATTKPPPVKAKSVFFAGVKKTLGKVQTQGSAKITESARMLTDIIKSRGEKSAANLPFLPVPALSEIPSSATGSELSMWKAIRQGDSLMRRAATARSLRERNRLLSTAIGEYTKAQGYKTNKVLYHNWGLALLAKALHVPEKKRSPFFYAAVDKFMAGNVVSPHYFDFHLASLYAIIGNREECRKWLEISRDNNVLDIESMKQAPDFDSVRNEAWFDEFLSE